MPKKPIARKGAVKRTGAQKAAKKSGTRKAARKSGARKAAKKSGPRKGGKKSGFRTAAKKTTSKAGVKTAKKSPALKASKKTGVRKAAKKGAARKAVAYGTVSVRSPARLPSERSIPKTAHVYVFSGSTFTKRSAHVAKKATGRQIQSKLGISQKQASNAHAILHKLKSEGRIPAVD